MKLLDSYQKELKIAARGFYFHVELLVSLLVLAVLLMVVKPWPDGRMDEYIFHDMPKETADFILERDLKAGRIAPGENKEVELRPETFRLVNKESGREETFDFPDKRAITVPTVSKINSSTGAKKGTVYLMPDRVSVLRAAFKTGDIGAVISTDGNGKFSYEYIDQGYETEKYDNVLYVLHTYDIETIEGLKSRLRETAIGTRTRLNTRQSVVPVYVTFACCLMGLFVACGYVFQDKSENVIKAFLVTPASTTTYLLSKILVVLTTILLSASLVTLPVMKGLPDYPLFYLMLLASSFAFSALGLFFSSFYKTMGQAFGVLYLVVIILLLPVIPYYAGSFDPRWIHVLPSWFVLECFKEILGGEPSGPFVTACCAGLLAAGIALLVVTGKRFRKALSM